MDIGSALSESEKSKLLALVGEAMIAIREGQHNEKERAAFRELVGLLAAILAAGKIAERVGGLESAIGILQQEVAGLQRMQATVS